MSRRRPRRGPTQPWARSRFRAHRRERIPQERPVGTCRSPSPRTRREPQWHHLLSRAHLQRARSLHRQRSAETSTRRRRDRRSPGYTESISTITRLGTPPDASSPPFSIAAKNESMAATSMTSTAIVAPIPRRCEQSDDAGLASRCVPASGRTCRRGPGPSSSAAPVRHREMQGGRYGWRQPVRPGSPATRGSTPLPAEWSNRRVRPPGRGPIVWV